MSVATLSLSSTVANCMHEREHGYMWMIKWAGFASRFAKIFHAILLFNDDLPKFQPPKFSHTQQLGMPVLSVL